jgi:hypothetical protein
MGRAAVRSFINQDGKSAKRGTRDIRRNTIPLQWAVGFWPSFDVSAENVEIYFSIDPRAAADDSHFRSFAPIYFPASASLKVYGIAVYSKDVQLHRDTTAFSKLVLEYLTDVEYVALQSAPIADPEAGPVVPGSEVFAGCDGPLLSEASVVAIASSTTYGERTASSGC